MRLEAAPTISVPGAVALPVGLHGGVPWPFREVRFLGSGSRPLSWACPRGARPLSPSPRSPLQGGQEAHAPGGPESDSDGGAGERRSAACRIKLGASKLKIHIYFNRSGCSEGDEREGR